MSGIGYNFTGNFYCSMGTKPRWLHLCLILCCMLPIIGSLSLKPPVEEILNKHLCPDPVISTSSKLRPPEFANIFTIRLQPRPRSVTRSRFIRPCTFIEDASLTQQHASDVNTTLVKIHAINLNASPWNFSSSSGECSKFFMFRSWPEYGSGYTVMCGRENFDQFQGPWGHPMILYYHLTDQGMAFPLFHPNIETMALSPSSASSPSGGTGLPRELHQQIQHRNLLELKYMLIYYSIRAPDGSKLCRLQQYSLNSLSGECPSLSNSLASICGEYQCGELEALYKKQLGELKGDMADFQQQRFIIVKSKTEERYRVRNFLRQKLVPIMFLILLICGYKTYMKAGLRLHEHQLPMPLPETRLGRFQSQMHSRDPFRDIYFDYGGGTNDNNIPLGLHIPYEPTTTGGLARTGAPVGGSTSDGKYLPPSDPPPPYDTLFPPPYAELFYSSPAPQVPNDNVTPAASNSVATVANAKNSKV